MDGVCDKGWTGRYVFCGVDWVEAHINAMVAQWLVNWGTFAVHLILLCIWHLLGHEMVEWVKGRVGSRIAFKMFKDWPRRPPGLRHWCLSVVVLNIYYKRQAFWNILGPGPFVTSAFFLVFDAFGFSWIGCALVPERGRRVRRKPRQVINRYQQISLGFFPTLIFFAAQCMLMMYYVVIMNEDQDTKHTSNVNFTRWFTGVLLMLAVGQDEVGFDFDWKFWKDAQSQEDKVDKAKRGRFLTFQWKCRSAFDFFINLIARLVILNTVPIMVSKSDPEEFIKDCLAVFFITRLDDLQHPSTLEEEIELINTGQNRTEDDELYNKLEASPDE